MEKPSVLQIASPVYVPQAASRSPRQLIWRVALASCLTVYTLYTLSSGFPPHWNSATTCHHSPHSESPYGVFPKLDDAFHLLPCTNATVPPALDDPTPLLSWASLYDPDPSHWSWGNRASKHTLSASNPVDAYAGRGIYLCGWLDVPLDYTNASDPRVARLAITKYQQSGLQHRDDLNSKSGRGIKSVRTIIIEPGGPGGSGTDFVWRRGAAISETYSSEAYDVLGWDPRGVNTSLPAIRCQPADASPYVLPRWSALTRQYREAVDPETQLALVDAWNEAEIRACWEALGDLGRFMGTGLVARDLDEIRKALGEEEVTGYFVSYGTGIGQTYASMFPDKVGRLILDGTEYVRDHRLLGGFGWTALDNGTDAWHDGFLGECVNAGPEYCALAKLKGKDNHNITLKELKSRMAALVDFLITRPMVGYTTTTGPALITYSDVVSMLYGTMYNAFTWPAVAQILCDLESGNTTLMTEMLATGWTRPELDDYLGTMVICADSFDAPTPPPGGLEWWSSLWANMTTRSWIAGNSRFSNVFPCRYYSKYWPEPVGAYRGDLNKTLANPLLLIAETYDPATPLRNGRRLLEEMGRNARLVVHHGYGHSSRDTSACTNEIARRYIVHGKVPEEKETDCFADEKPYLYGVGKGKGMGVGEGESEMVEMEVGSEQVVRDPFEELRLLMQGTKL